MRRLLLVLAALIALPIMPASAQKATPKWTETVVITPEGGYRQGNPNAPVKLF